MNRRLLGSLLAVVLVPIAACESESSSVPPGGSVDGTVPSLCAEPKGEGTVHDSIDLATSEETWSAAASPHIVSVGTTIRADQKLTIEPCAVVRIRQGASLLVNGSLVADGAADRPIRFERADTNGPWGKIEVGRGASAHLTHVSLQGGGYAGGADPATVAMVDVRGDQDAPPQGTVHLESVLIEGSASLGILLREGGALAAGSKDVTVTKSASAPLRSWARSAGSIPNGSYSGNADDEILIAAEGPRDAVREDMVLAHRGIPYRVLGSELRVGHATAENAPKATLTIEAGVTLRFAKGSRLSVDAYTSDVAATGVLHVQGTAEAPVIFTSAESAPAAGDWVGITFKGAPDPTNAIDHAILSYAGGDSGISSYDCPNPEKKSFSNYGSIVLFGKKPARGFVTNTTFEHSAGDGVVRGWTGDEVDFLATNTFTGIALCNQSHPKPEGAACPEKPPCAKN